MQKRSLNVSTPTTATTREQLFRFATTPAMLLADATKAVRTVFIVSLMCLTMGCASNIRIEGHGAATLTAWRNAFPGARWHYFNCTIAIPNGDMGSLPDVAISVPYATPIRLRSVAVKDLSVSFYAMPDTQAPQRMKWYSKDNEQNVGGIVIETTDGRITLISIGAQPSGKHAPGDATLWNAAKTTAYPLPLDSKQARILFGPPTRVEEHFEF